MELCRYLFGRFKEVGVRHVFGIPSDFVLPFFRVLEEEPGIEPVILTHASATTLIDADPAGHLLGPGAATGNHRPPSER